MKLCVILCEYLLSLSVRFSGFILCNIPLYRYNCVQLIQLIEILIVSTFLAVMNNAVVNILVQVLCGCMFSFC